MLWDTDLGAADLRLQRCQFMKTFRGGGETTGVPLSTGASKRRYLVKYLALCVFL